MSEPPSQLDGAQVLYWTESKRGGFYRLEGCEPSVIIMGMAVARYASGGRFYLFKCDADWSVVQDWDCASVEESLELATGHSGGERLVWNQRANPAG